MPIPSPGSPLSITTIQAEFGGGGSISLSEYYRNGSYVLSTDFAPNVPASGTISIGNFYGAQRTNFQGIAFNGSQAWFVPASLGTSAQGVNVYVKGGGGGGVGRADAYGQGGGYGGNGGFASQTIPTSGGATHYITVGGAGAAGYFGNGYNGPRSDSFSGGGGGASNALGVYAGGGGAGKGYNTGAPGGGDPYGGYGGQGNNGWYQPATNYTPAYEYASGQGGNGADGGGSGDYLGQLGSFSGYGLRGSPAEQSYPYSYPGTQGRVEIYGWW
jgi:hypothetical protein